MKTSTYHFDVKVTVQDHGEFDPVMFRDAIIAGLESQKAEGGLTNLGDESTIFKQITVARVESTKQMPVAETKLESRWDFFIADNGTPPQCGIMHAGNRVLVADLAYQDTVIVLVSQLELAERCMDLLTFMAADEDCTAMQGDNLKEWKEIKAGLTRWLNPELLAGPVAMAASKLGNEQQHISEQRPTAPMIEKLNRLSVHQLEVVRTTDVQLASVDLPTYHELAIALSHSNGALFVESAEPRGIIAAALEAGRKILARLMD